MAKTISDEKMKLDIIINGNEAQKQLSDLEKKTRRLNEENKENLRQKKLLETQGKKDTDAYRTLTRAIKENNAEVTANKNKMKELQDQLGLTGLTLNQLSSKALALKMALRNTVPGSELNQKYATELKGIQDRINEVSGKAKEAKLSIGSLADGFNRYQGIALSFIATLTGVAFSIQKIIDINGKLSDAQADVMKTTGMTKTEVDELTKSFGLLQTRTSRMDLLNIAEQGGRIGIAKNEISDFVNVMNKASVALGDSFTGGAEEVASKLGKLKFLFQETKNMGVEQAYNSIGSAINDLGANGVASEANIAEFATRLGSLPDELKPTIKEALALGAAFEESGIEAEVSSRAYNIFLKQAATESGKFAKVMNISKQEVEALINKNPMEFMMKFAKGMKGVDVEGTQMAKTLDYLGINADGANKIIGAMGNNFGRFQELISLSNNSFESGISLINEYEIKNNNLAATLEKLKKAVTGWFSSETFIDWLSAAVEWIANFVGVTKNAESSAVKWRIALVFIAKVLAIAVASMISYNAVARLIALTETTAAGATNAHNIALKMQGVWLSLQRVALTIYTGAMNVLGFSTDKATASLVRLNTATKLSPWGAVLAVVTAVIAAYIAFSEQTKKVVTAQQTLNQIHDTTLSNIAKEKTEVDSLVKVIRSENTAKDDKIKALKRLNDIIPDYIGNLTLENINTKEGIEILQKYTAELYKNARAKAVKNKYDELVEKQLEIEQKSLSDYQSDTSKFFKSSKVNKDYENIKSEDDYEKLAKERVEKLMKNKNYAGRNNKAKYDADVKWYKESIKRQFEDVMSEKKAELDAIDSQLKALEPELVTATVTELKSDEKTKYNMNASDSSGASSGTKKDPNSTQAEIDRLKLEAQTKYAEAALRLQRQLEDDRIAAMEDGYAKELALENQRYQREIDDLQRQKVHTEEMAKFDEDIAKAKQDKDITRYNSLLQIKKGWKEKNLLLDAQINQIIEGKAAIHNLKLATIEEKGAKDILEKRKKDHEEAKVQRELAYQQELLALGNNEIAKRKLTQQYQQNELNEEEKFLKELLDKFKDIIDKGGFEGINLDLLSPEQVAQFEAEAAKVGLSLQQLIQKKRELQAKQNADDPAALGIGGGEADIFGFTPSNWLQLFDNLESGKLGINEMVFAVQALTNAFSLYDQFATASENKRLQQFEKQSNQKKNLYKKQLDSGAINQNQYNKLTEQQDNELAKKKAEIEHKQAKRQKLMAISQIMMNTAQAIMGIWAQFPKFDFGATAAIMSGVVGALGLAQIAKVAKEPLPSPGFEEGLYDTSLIRRQQDGKVFSSRFGGKTKSGLVKDTSHYMVGENGPEMIIDNKAWTQMNPNLKDALIREIQSIKGFENGYYKEGTLYSGNTNTNVEDNSLYPMMLAMLTENVALLQYFKENGLNAYVSNKDMNSMRKLKEGLDKYNAIRTENRK